MTRMRLWISAAIIGLIVLVAFVLSVPHARDLGTKLKSPAAATSTPTVAVHDVYKKGTHTISGSLQVPNACTPISVAATPIGTASSTQGILVAITFQVDSGICLQEPTSVSFQTTLAAPANVPIQATINGSPASTTRS